MKLLTKKIGILGHGKEGKSLSKFLESRRVRDLKVFDEKLEDFPNFTEIDDREVLFRSPGVSPHHEDLQNFRGKVISGTELFLQLCPTKKIIGVTGTKGKGTTSTLITRMFEEANDTVFLLGNIGNPFFDELPNVRTRDVVIMELSSFQLWDCEQSPQISVLLRITPDHLEKHGSFDEYVEAKKNIFLHQKSGGKVIYCADCPIVSELVQDLPEETTIPISTKKELKKGAFLRNDELIWKTDEGEEVIVTREEVKLRGDYNIENILAAIAAAKLINVRSGPIATAIHKFAGLPFRLQLVAATIDNIKFWNDSCATVPGATIAGISTFTDPLILITGGSVKNVDYTELGTTIAQNKNLKKVLLIGKTGSLIKKAIEKAGGDKKLLLDTKDFATTFEVLKDIVQPGDNILLSPASASFDQFENEFDRGEKWNIAVNEFLRSRK